MLTLFFMRFLVNSFIISAVILIILIIKKVFNKHITTRWQNNIGLLFLIILVLPFIPDNLLNLRHLYSFSFNNINKNSVEAISLNNEGSSLLYNLDWSQDFSASVNRLIPEIFILFLITVWILGIFILLLIVIICNNRLNFIKKNIYLYKNKEVELLFEECKIKLKISKNIILGSSSLIQTPMATGILKPYIILPDSGYQNLSLNDMKYIFLHELNHYKAKDILINYIMCFFQIIYWFNPLIWLAFKQMISDREIACDISVLKTLDKSQYIDYGKTIINFIEKMSKTSNLSVSTNMGGSKQEIKKRIEKIVTFTGESKQLKTKSVILFIIASFIILSQTPNISTVTYLNNKYKYNFQKDLLVYEDLSSHFSNFKGSFVLYDINSGQYTIYNKDRSTLRVSPDSTYKIYTALIALELDIIQSENSTLNWDGNFYPYPSWNQNQNLKSALQNSVNWYFHDIDKKIGRKRLQSFYKKINYGNYDLSSGVSDYWMESSLLISPLEQVQLLKNFYTNDIVFEKKNINIIKQILRLSEKDGAVLSGKTGTGVINDKNTNGWFIGYVEKDDNTFIFATNIQGKNNATGKSAVNITLSILSEKNIY